MRRKRNYYAYSRYGKRRLNYKKVGIVVLGAVLVLGIVFGLLFNRIKLSLKGYSFKEVNLILKQPKASKKTILKEDKIENITEWINTSDKYDYYDEYEKYYESHTDLTYKAVVKNIDTIFDQYVENLENLNYSDEEIWKLLQNADASQVKYVVDNSYTYSELEGYIDVKTFDVTKLSQYKDAYQEYHSYNYAVLIVNYPAIDSSNKVSKTYTIQNTNSYQILVKKGFTLSSKYKPKDLVDVSGEGYNLKVADDCDNPYMRKKAAKALVQMFDAAKKEGYDLVVNSAYRSYKDQKEVYDEYHKIYDEVTANSLVSYPGTSEHQTGLGVDLTCQSVLDDKANGIENTRFSYKEDYTWCKENAYKYGYILRFSEGTSSITGIANEPWHFRYVGKKAAKKCYENNWTFEEYILYTGDLPTLKENS